RARPPDSPGPREPALGAGRARLPGARLGRQLPADPRRTGDRPGPAPSGPRGARLPTRLAGRRLHSCHVARACGERPPALCAERTGNATWMTGRLTRTAALRPTRPVS